MSGVVSDLKDPEKRGRARVVFPAISRDQASDWARIATVGAGGNRGLVVIPEVDDEVLVAFEGGDLRRPVILAGLHNGKDKIPEHDVAHGVAHRRFTSRLGHVVELADGAQPAEQHVLLALAGGEHRIRLGKDRLDVEVPSGVPLSIKAGTTTIVVDGSNGLTIEADTIAVKARRQLSLEGPTVQIKATQALDLSAGTNLTVKAAGATSIEADGMTTVKGKAVAIN
nr:phage baseplate assembly protein V [Jiangella mangrovi]